MLRKCHVLQLVVAVGLCWSFACSANLIVNGDFEAGDTGFTSGHTSQTWQGPPDVYTITTNPGAGNPGSPVHHPGAASYGDHTTGTGNMMMVNGSTTAGDIVWEQTVAVVAGATYDFAAYISSWVSGAPADLRFKVNGVEIGSLVAPLAVGIWDVEFATWNSLAATSATIQITNANVAFSGNDFALDDLFFGDPIFSQAPAPGTMALLAAGLLGWRMQRRRARPTRY